MFLLFEVLLTRFLSFREIHVHHGLQTSSTTAEPAILLIPLVFVAIPSILVAQSTSDPVVPSAACIEPIPFINGS